jgi:hypothetical protein
VRYNYWSKSEPNTHLAIRTKRCDPFTEGRASCKRGLHGRAGLFSSHAVLCVYTLVCELEGQAVHQILMEFLNSKICPICNIVCINPRGLKRHIRTHYPGSTEKIIRCGYCSLVFTKPDNFSRHLRTQVGTKNSFASYLLLHLLLHFLL